MSIINKFCLSVFVLLFSINLFSCQKEIVDNEILEIIDDIEITSEDDWEEFVSEYNKSSGIYADDISVKIICDLNLKDVSGLGTSENHFSGKIDFTGHRICYDNTLIAYADDVTVINANINSFYNSKPFCSSLIGNCYGTADIKSIGVNNVDGIKDGGDMLFFNSPIFVSTGRTIILSDIEVQGTTVSGYDNASGLINTCESLQIYGLEINNTTVQALYGYLVADASLVVRKSEKIYAENVTISHANVSAIHYASGFALECNEMSVNSFLYKDSVIISYPNNTLPNSAHKLVCRDLKTFDELGLSFENVIVHTGNKNVEDDISASAVTVDGNSLAE